MATDRGVLGFLQGFAGRLKDPYSGDAAKAGLIKSMMDNDLKQKQMLLDAATKEKELQAEENWRFELGKMQIAERMERQKIANAVKNSELYTRTMAAYDKEGSKKWEAMNELQKHAHVTKMVASMNPQDQDLQGQVMAASKALEAWEKDAAHERELENKRKEISYRVKDPLMYLPGVAAKELEGYRGGVYGTNFQNFADKLSEQTGIPRIDITGK